MNLLVILKYILPLTIVFDATISLFLIRKSFHNPIVRLYFLVLVTLVAWEILFWFGIFTNYSVVANDLVDRVAFVVGLIAQYGLLIFLIQYATIKLSNNIRRSIKYVTLLVLTIIAIFGVGPRLYFSEATYNYSLAYEQPYSMILGLYYVTSISITIFSFYCLTQLLSSKLSYLEIARRKLIRGSVLVTLLFTIIPAIVIPLIILLLGKSVTEQLASNWYISILVIGAICSSAWTATTAYAMTRYRLFDVTVKIRRSLLLMACAIGLGLVLFGANQLLFSPYLDNLEQSVAIAVLTVAASLVMIFCTRKFGMGDPISFALMEPVAVDTTVKELAQKLQHYLQTEFELTVDGIYLLDPKKHNFFDVKTGMALTAIPEAMLKNLQMELLVQEHLPTQLKSSTALLAIVNGDFLLGFVAISTLQRNLLLSPIKQGIITASKYFAQLLYQAMFSSYIYAAAATKQA